MAYPSWVPPPRGIGVPRIPIGLFNWDDQRVPSNVTQAWFTDVGSQPGMVLLYAGHTLAEQASNVYYGFERVYDPASYARPSTKCIPVVGMDLAGKDGSFNLVDTANGVFDSSLQQMVQHAYNHGYTTAAGCEVYWRLGYEVNQQTCTCGWNGDWTNWAPQYRAAFTRSSQVIRAESARLGVTSRIVFDTLVQLYKYNSPLVGAYKPAAADYDILSIDHYGGSPYFGMDADWLGYQAQVPFTPFIGPWRLPAGETTIDSYQVDGNPNAAIGGIGYTFNNCAYNFVFAGSDQYNLDGAKGEGFVDMLRDVCVADQKPFMSSEWGYSPTVINGVQAWGGGGGFGSQYQTAIITGPGYTYTVANDRNYWPYWSRMMASIEAGSGKLAGPVPHLGGCVYDAIDGNAESGSDGSRGGFVDGGMLATIKAAFVTGGGAPLPFLSINSIGTIVQGSPVAISANFGNITPTVNSFKYNIDGGSYQSLPSGATVNANSVSFPLNTSALTAGSHTLDLQDADISLIATPATFAIVLAAPTGAAITVPASIPNQTAGQLFNVQAAFNYTPIYANIQYSVNLTTQGIGFVPLASDAAGTPTLFGNLLTIPILNGIQAPHIFQVQDTTYSPPIQSAQVPYNIGTTGGGGTVPVTTPTPIIETLTLTLGTSTPFAGATYNGSVVSTIAETLTNLALLINGVSGSLPNASITTNGLTASFSGTLPNPGSYAFQVVNTVSGVKSNIVNQTLSPLTATAPPSITVTSPGNQVQGVAYSVVVTFNNYTPPSTVGNLSVNFTDTTAANYVPITVV